MIMRHRAQKTESPGRHATGRGPVRRGRPLRAAWTGGRSGLTLVELLIVIGVMVILLGLALPMLKTGLEGRQIREASRQLSTYVELAKAQAAETGRPAGLEFVTETLPEDTAGVVRFASRMYLTETPLPYVGDVVHADVLVSGTQLTFGGDSMSLPYIGVGPGDLIKFSFKGFAYEIDTVGWAGVPSPTPPYSATIKIPTGFPVPPTGLHSYQVLRQPQRSSSMPLELATGAVVDLKNSGFGLTGIEFAASDPTMPYGAGRVSIIFQPDGSIAYTLIDGVVFEQLATVHLLIGRIDHLIPENVGDPDMNLADPDTRWVSVGHQTGKVTVAENGGNELDTTMAMCREFAQSAQSMGGR
jgi:type II secretory pathway pseudopilin PulG